MRDRRGRTRFERKDGLAVFGEEGSSSSIAASSSLSASTAASREVVSYARVRHVLKLTPVDLNVFVFAFEEAGFEPELGPSAPPFESQGYDAREHDIPPIVPSAPPMLEDEDFYGELVPSAPPSTEVDGHDGGDHPDGPQASAPSAPDNASTAGGPPSLNDSDYGSEAPSLPRYCP